MSNVTVINPGLLCLPTARSFVLGVSKRLGHARFSVSCFDPPSDFARVRAFRWARRGELPLCWQCEALDIFVERRHRVRWYGVTKYMYF